MCRLKLSALAIDDAVGDVVLLREELKRIPSFDVRLAHADNVEAAQAALAEPGVDLIFLDYVLGERTGLELLQAIRASGDLRPVIVLTGQGSEDLAASLMRAGADDYLVKGRIESARLARAIENARARHVHRQMEWRNRELLEELRVAKTTLELRNRRLAELYDTAHQFVDHVSHEFRTPLTVIKEFASIMHDGLTGELSDEQREYLSIIVNRVNDLAILVDDMLDISKLEAGVLGVSRANQRIDAIVQRFRPTLERRARAAGAELVIDVPPDLPGIFCDGEKIGRVITNLVINALKFAGRRPQVRLRARADYAGRAVRIDVSDNGAGIAPETRDAIFERFRQVAGHCRRGVKGFGLGLSIAKELVDLNFGDISVESELGAGSTFWFTVPMAERRPLLQRILERVVGLRDDVRFVGLLEIACPPTAEPDSLDDFDLLLQHQVRRTDVVFRVASARWLVLCPASRSDESTLVSRLEKTWSESNRHRPAGALPRFRARWVGSWGLSEGAGLIEAFLDREAKVEPACA